MQFHHMGYVSGDPAVEQAAGTGVDRPDELPDRMDVLIVGTGPAGVVAAAQLSQFPAVTTRIVERRPGRLAIGQADGIQARSVETFAAFGFAEKIITEAYRIEEMAFWKPRPDDPTRIHRAARAPDDPAGISEFPHLIVNQARVLDYFMDFMRNGPTRMRPDYGWAFHDLKIVAGEDYPVAVTLTRDDGGAAPVKRVVRARYVVGADGARSAVRSAIGARHVGDQAFHAWGVMDALAVTDFPDIRTKCSIQSGAGNILLIPREGGYLFRMYVDLGEVPPDDGGAVRDTTLAQIVSKANDILHPYTLEVRNVPWHSVYEVGHRVTDRFDDVPAEAADGRLPRVFIAGDACHTHSAKAGQGMNVSIQDGWNLGWKLGYVLSGYSPASLLRTYSEERRAVAEHLIAFDKRWSTLMATKPEDLDDPTELENFYVSNAEFPAGFMTQYGRSMIVAEPSHQALATGFPIGKRFKSHTVVRVADGIRVHLGHHHRADGRWRIYAFEDGTDVDGTSALPGWADWLGAALASSLRIAHPTDDAFQDIFDVKVVYRRDHADIDIGLVPKVFLPRKGPFDLIDYERIYAVDPSADIFGARGIDRAGCVVIVRPDQYVAAIMPLTAPEQLLTFFTQHLNLFSDGRSRRVVSG